MRRFSIALGLLVTVATTAYADVYKTVDAQGQVHYSDQWSPGAVLIKGSTRAATDSSAPTLGASDRSVAADPAQASAAKKVQSDVQALRSEQCKQLKEQYEKVLRARRIYQPSADSSAPKQYMTDAEADAERVKTRQAMDEACAAGDQ